jgi:MoaA/NifB/PqqE/SkfB family radical SAM enzyme
VTLRPRIADAVSLALGRPLYALFQVTAKCNLQCRMCAVWEEGVRRPDLSLAEIEQVAVNLSRAGVRVVNVAGEPLLRSDLPAIVAAFSQRGMAVRMQTNATLAAARPGLVAEAVRAGLGGVTLSLDSLVPGKQAWICRSEGVWDRILEGLSLFGQRLPRRAVILLNCVVSRLNLDELPSLAEFALEAGYQVAFSPVHLSGDGRHDPQFVPAIPDEFLLRPEDHDRCDAAFARLLELRRQGAPVVNSRRFLERSCAFLKHGRAPVACHAGTRYLFIDHQGRAAPCHELAPEVDATAPAFAATVRSRPWRQRMETLQRRCDGCLLPCWVELSELLRRPHVALEMVPRTFRQRPTPRVTDPHALRAIAERLRVDEAWEGNP